MIPFTDPDTHLRTTRPPLRDTRDGSTKRLPDPRVGWLLRGLALVAGLVAGGLLYGWIR